MRKTRYRHFIVALWLMTFLGQALASASLCCEDPALSSQLEQRMFDANNSSTSHKPSIIDSSSITALSMNHSQHQQSKFPLSPKFTLDPQSALTAQPFFDADATPECISDCDCMMGGCAAAALSETRSGFNMDFVLPTSAYASQPQDHLITSLFRPPISR